MTPGSFGGGWAAECLYVPYEEIQPDGDGEFHGEYALERASCCTISVSHTRDYTWNYSRSAQRTHSYYGCDAQSAVARDISSLRIVASYLCSYVTFSKKTSISTHGMLKGL